MPRDTYQSDLSLDEKLMMTIVRASELFKKDASAIFKNWGLTFSQYNVLRVLESSENGRNTMSSTSKIILVSGANMTGLAKRLEKGGFLIRKSDPNDDRVTWLEITPKGTRTLKNIETEKEDSLRSYLKKFSDQEKRQILANLKEINGHVSQAASLRGE
jgi:MarR family transcriptional regulator, 2-MHQ and catechol-resistance regulon repressor